MIPRRKDTADRRRGPYLAIGFGLAFLSLFLIPRLYPENLGTVKWLGALVAGGAAAFHMRQYRALNEKLLHRRKRVVLRLLVLFLSVLVLLYTYGVVRVDKTRGTFAVAVGLGPGCCPDLARETCLTKRLIITDAAIHKCWGDFDVNSVRLGLILSYWGTALGFGALMGLGLVQPGKPYSTEVDTDEPIQAPTPSAATAFRYDLFVSYSSEDRPFVEALAADLQRKGLVLWWDQPQVKAGDSIASTIEEGLLASRRFAVVLSPSSRHSRWVAEETNAALALEKERQQRSSGERVPFVLPILYQECDVPVFLKDRRHADFRSSYEHGLQELLRHFIGGP